MAAHRCSSFAQEQLEKHGWKSGQGLGRTESGISEAIKVKIKHDTAGVGHDLGEQFTYHWWDHVFNKAASNIVVENNQEGVKMSSKEKSYGPISNKKQPKHAGKKPLLYGNFVRSAILTSEGMQQDEKESSSSEEDDVDTEDINIDDKFFKACGGRTAHKGARHGLNLSGKLKRIQEQEASYLYHHRSSQITNSPLSNQEKVHSKPRENNIDKVEEVVIDEETAKENRRRERKQRKKDKKLKQMEGLNDARCSDDKPGCDIMDKDCTIEGETKKENGRREKKQWKKDNKQKLKEGLDDLSCSDNLNGLDLDEDNKKRKKEK